jgi:hypothetical protein
MNAPVLAPLLGTVVVAGLLVALGRGLAGVGGRLARPGGLLAGAGFRLVVRFAAGAVVFHLLLVVLQGVGLPWSRATLALGTALLLGAGAALSRRPGRGRSEPRAETRTGQLPAGGAEPRSELRVGPLPPREANAWVDRHSLGLPPAAGRGWDGGWGWGDGLALLALAVFGCFALAAWAATPDFVYHWGLKGERFFLAGGIDYADLGRAWNEPVHPDYPNLLPELYAASALVAGRFSEPAMMLWSCGLFALLLLAVRTELGRAGCRRQVAQAALALIALAVAAFGLGDRMAGAADWLIALALAAAAVPLAADPSPEGDLQIGALAALAAAGKVEGLPLAAFLVGAALVLPVPPRRGVRAAWAPRRLARLALPTLMVALPWLLEVRRHHLFQQFNSGPFEAARAPRLAEALLTALRDPGWHGFGWALLLVPLLWLDRRVRPLGGVIAAQLAFYLYVYFTVRIDAAALVLASFPRLMLHLIPATLLGAVVAAERAARAGRPAPAAEPATERSLGQSLGEPAGVPFAAVAGLAPPSLPPDVEPDGAGAPPGLSLDSPPDPAPDPAAALSPFSGLPAAPSPEPFDLPSAGAFLPA